MNSLAGSTVIYGAAEVVGRAITFVAFLLFANLLSVSDFGTIALLTSLVGLVGMVGNMGLNSAVQRHYFDASEVGAGRQTVVSTGFLLLAGSTLGTAILFAALGLLFRVQLEARFGVRSEQVLLAAGIAVPVQVLAYMQDVVRLRFNAWQFAILAVARSALVFGLAYLLISLFGLRVDGYLWGLFAATAALLPLAAHYIRGDLRLVFDRNAGLRLACFGIPLLGAGVANWAMASVDLWLLGSMAGANEVGLYGIAARLASVLAVLNAALGQAWAPYALAAHATNPDYRRMVVRFFNYWFYALTIAGVALALFARELLMLFTRADYWPAAGPLCMLAAGAVFLGTTQVTMLGLSLERRTGVLAICAWAAALLNVALNLTLIPALGAFGAACANALSFLALTLLYLYFSQRWHPMPMAWLKLGSILVMLAAGVTGAIYLNAQPVSFQLIILKALVMGLLLVAGLFVGIYRPTDIRRSLRAIAPRTR